MTTLTKGSDLSETNLRPVYATNPRFFKKLPDGGKKYEFNFLMKQGNMTFHDLHYEDPVREALRDFTMKWTASNIRGPDRVCIGWMFGKHPDHCIMSNFKESIRHGMPKDAPGFDLRIEPETKSGAWRYLEIKVALPSHRASPSFRHQPRDRHDVAMLHVAVARISR